MQSSIWLEKTLKSRHEFEINLHLTIRLKLRDLAVKLRGLERDKVL